MSPLSHFQPIFHVSAQNKLCKTILHDRYVPTDRFQIVGDGDFRSFDPSHMNEIVKQLGDVPDSIFSSTGCCKTCSLGNTRSVFQQPEAQNVLESKLNSSGVLHFRFVQARNVCVSQNPDCWWIVKISQSIRTLPNFTCHNRWKMQSPITRN